MYQDLDASAPGCVVQVLMCMHLEKIIHFICVYVYSSMLDPCSTHATRDLQPPQQDPSHRPFFFRKKDKTPIIFIHE